MRPSLPTNWLRYLTTIVVTLSIPLFASAAPSVADEPYFEKMPPLIERELFFGDPKIAGSSISPDGRWISFIKPHKDVMNIWVKGIDQAFEDARPITADTNRPVTSYRWSEDSRYILYVQDKGGDENYHLYAVNPTGDIDTDSGVPTARDLTPVDGVRVFILALPEATPNEIVIGLNDRNPALHDVYRVNIDTGDRKVVITNNDNITAWVTDLAGNVRLATRQRDDGGYETMVLENGKTGRVLIACDFGDTCNPVRIHKNGKQVYVVSNVGVDLAQLMLVDIATGKETFIESDPEKEVDLSNMFFSDVTDELIATVYVGDRIRIYPQTEDLKAQLDWLREQLPDGEFGINATTEDESKWLINVSRDVNPGAVYFYDATAKTIEKLYDSRPELPSEHLAPMRAIRYPTRDGVEIPAYLVTPKGVDATNLPTLIVPHGGPWARDTWGYNSFAQFFANRGYAVLMPNFRGSTGYGKAFLNAGNKEWGTGIMQHDISDGVAYLVKAGIADPKRIGITGGSYGGYATLAGLAFTPDLYAAGASIVGPSNIFTLLNSIPPYWGPLIQTFYKRVGNPNDTTDAERMRAQSPFFHASNIKAPLLVIQGANDPRVKQAESDQIVVAMRDLNRPVQYLVAPDEGHGFRGKENRLAMFAAMEQFFAKHLGGRSQTDMADTVAEKLKALKVDVTTVTLPDMPNAAGIVQPDVSKLAPSKRVYETELEMGGQTFKSDSMVEIARAEYAENSVWKVDMQAKTFMGDAGDTFLLAADSLHPVHRSFFQGAAKGTLDYTDTAISGSLTIPGRGEMPVKTSLETPVFGSDFAFFVMLETLPLEIGYRASGDTFDLRTLAVRQWVFEVTGEESVDVPGGKFDTIVMKLTDPDGGGGQVWFKKSAPQYVIKSEISLPAAMGGGMSTRVLKSFEE